MDKKGGCNSSSSSSPIQEVEVRKGPWTMEEDLILINYIANHGEGVWNSLARSAGLKRSGKSCRLRWLNYLRPDVRRGNITPEEQLLIMELHAKWGNRWSKIAKHLPGRTDNEIKNYWRTRIQKHIKQGESSNNACNNAQNLGQQNNQVNSSQYCGSAIQNNEMNEITYVTSTPSYPTNVVENYQPHFPSDTNENIWGMEDLWSLNLLNGD